MSDTVSNDVSTESLCTVIENSTDDIKLKGSHIIVIENNEIVDQDDNTNNSNETCEKIDNSKFLNSTNNKYKDLKSDDGTNESLSDSNEDKLSTSQKDSDTSLVESLSTLSKLKKSVTFDPNDEKIQKFITGEPIIDQKNPFKINGNSTKKKKTPPPVPTKRSTLSVRKTVTQQLREREREKEKERERAKNEANNRQNNLNGIKSLSSPDEHITTEDVLKQSKYVKTYIKNPDPYFVYDPTVLARIKFEQLREISDKKPTKKVKILTTNQSGHGKERLKDLKSKSAHDIATSVKTKNYAFKKCSKPNYPELADIKIKVGTEPDANFFNPEEVTKNAKKFDERVKKLHISSDDDLDELEGPLTKSESSDEVTVISNTTNHQQDNATKKEEFLNASVMNDTRAENQTGNGNFTNTITSKEFQEFLDKKGLTLIPTKIPSGAQSIYKNGITQPNSNSYTKVPATERIQIAYNTMDSTKNHKKPSVFQRLLANSIFASRRKTTPKETVPFPKPLYDYRANKAKENGGNVPNNSSIKRVVLERQSFHGRTRSGNLLGVYETEALRSQNERTRKSFAGGGGDDQSISISSALTNAEFADCLDGNRPPTKPTIELQKPERTDLQNIKPIAKPPRRTLSGERISNVQQLRNECEQRNIIIKPKVYRPVEPKTSLHSLNETNNKLKDEQPVHFRRTLERQSLIPKKISQTNDKNLIFRRSASMDRNEILKRSANRGAQLRLNSVHDISQQLPTMTANAKKDVQREPVIQNGPQLTSTPIRNQTGLNVAQQDWERLRAIKERTDREFYLNVIKQQQQQQQQQQLNSENIYEHLKPNQILMLQQAQATQNALPNNNFIRGSPQRNTYSGALYNHRQTKIIDGKTVSALVSPQPQGSLNNLGNYNNNTLASKQQNERCQSALGTMTTQVYRKNLRRGYESDTEPPVVVLRQKNAPLSTDADGAQPRRIGGILTREEIMQKVKEFCRKSINKTPTIQTQAQVIYNKQQAISTDISPVSYASVETHQRPTSRMYAAPQVPQRMQSLPQQFIPISQQSILHDPNAMNTASPIYAHVVKRSSIQSNQSELLYESPQRPYIVQRDGAYYIGPETIQQQQQQQLQQQQLQQQQLQQQQQQQQYADSVYPQTQFVILDGDKLIPAQLLNYQPAEIYAQPQYLRPQRLQPIPGTYGYITVQETMPTTQQMRPRLHDGRSTPLILDRSSQQASQIYWTPQHQRLQQQARLLPIEVSPRYMPKQLFPVPAPRMSQINSAAKANTTTANLAVNIPEQQQQQQQQQQQIQKQQQILKQQQQQQQVLQAKQKAAITEQNYLYEWESGSEAGEVQRIMERQRNSDAKHDQQNE